MNDVNETNIHGHQPNDEISSSDENSDKSAKKSSSSKNIIRVGSRKSEVRYFHIECTNFYLDEMNFENAVSYWIVEYPVLLVKILFWKT